MSEELGQFTVDVVGVVDSDASTSVTPSSTPATGSPRVSLSSASLTSLSTDPSPCPPSTSDVYPPTSLGPVPPLISTPYDPATDALADIKIGRHGVELFLSGHMHEAEHFCAANDPRKERLYFTLGYGILRATVAGMRYNQEDLLAAAKDNEHTMSIACKHRKSNSLVGRVSNMIVGSQGWIRSMTPLERHAELVYAEAMELKSALGLFTSTSWTSFLREGLALHSAHTIYTSLHKFMNTSDAAYSSSHPGGTGKDPAIDEDFRSGVLLGVGCSAMILSMLPPKVLSIVEMFGYTGERRFGLDCLMAAGGWAEGAEEEGPGIRIEEEGLRRPLCDFTLLGFHLIASALTFEGVSIPLASRILSHNLRRYPNGPFALLAAARLSLITSRPDLAKTGYERALRSQDQYVNLQHCCWWEMGMAAFAEGEGSAIGGPVPETMGNKLGGLGLGRVHWESMKREGTWSPATFGYAYAACLLELAQDAQGEEAERIMDEAVEVMKSITGLSQRIAGKSVPIEKFCARKSRLFLSKHASSSSFTAQPRNLVVPLMEFTYFWSLLSQCRLSKLLSFHIPRLHDALARVEAGKPAWEADEAEARRAKKEKAKTKKEKKEGEKLGGYWDDYCLVRFLEGACWRYVAYQAPESAAESRELPSDITCPDQKEATESALNAFQDVLKHAGMIRLDHWIIYFTHYELGRLFENMGQREKALEELEVVLSGKRLETKYKRKGRYNLESIAIIRATAAKEAIEKDQRV